MKRYEINARIRKLLGMTVIELANRVEVSRYIIAQYEKGFGKNRPLERVIEIELDSAIIRCPNDDKVKLCRILKTYRSEHAD